MAQVAAEYGEEPKDFDAEECQGEDMRGRRKAGGEHGGSHEGSVGREGGRESI